MIRPTKQYYPFPGYPAVGLLLFGSNDGATNWSLVGLIKQRDTQNDADEVTRKIAAIVEQHDAMRGITTLYAPTIDFSGRIVGQNEFRGGISLSLPPNEPLKLLRDKGSDGLEVPRGAAALINGADSPIVSFFLPKAGRDSTLLAAHCARWSLINEAWVLGMKHSRRSYEGVVEQAVNRLGSEHASGIRVHIACSIGGEHFRHSVDHPRYGEVNKRLVDYVVKKWGAACFVGNNLNDGRLHLPALIQAQCREAGIPDDNVTWDKEDTFSSPEPGGSKPKWWSHVRSTERHEYKDKGKRNLVIVVHR